MARNVTTRCGNVRVLGEQRREFRETRRREQLKDAAHLAAHRQLLARDQMMAVDVRARNEHGPGGLEVVGRHVRQARRDGVIEPDADRREVAVGQRQFVDRARRLFHALVFEQSPHQLGPRIFCFGAGDCRRLGQQQARLDLDQHRGHQQILGREFQLRAPHHLDVAQVLPRQFRHRNVENVDVLPADEIEQQVQRPFERIEENLERVRRNVQVERQVVERLAIDARQRLGLGRRMFQVECDVSHS